MFYERENYFNNLCGLYLDNCTGYWIEGNTFNNPTPTPGLRPVEVIGITVNNSGGNANEIYRNTFNGLDYGILAQNSNRNSDGSDGLVIKCNDFGPSDANIIYDVAVTAYEECVNPGIKTNQGSNDNSTTPAGNMFSHRAGIDSSDYYNAMDSANIFYYQHIANPQRLDLEDYSTSSITKEQTQLTYIDSISCQSFILKSESETKSSIAENEIKADSVDFLLDALVDGGDTQELESDVASSTPPEAYTVYNDLMMKSPYLTDTVMLEVVNKEDVLNSVMVKNVMVANPQSAKSDEVMTELENRINPLPDYMIEEIEAGKDSIGEKERMEASKSYFRHQQAIHLNLLKQIYNFDKSNAGYGDSLIALLQAENTLNAKYELAFEYTERGDYNLATAVLSDIPNAFVLNDEQATVHQHYLSMMPIVTEILQYNKSVFDLDSNQFDLLSNIALDSNYVPGIYARNMLVYAGKLVYNEPYILPDTSGLKVFSYNEPASITASAIPKFKVYPNPAGSYIAIEYNLDEVACDGRLIMLDNLGKTFKAIEVSKSKHSLIISTAELKNGVYYLSLYCNDKQIATEKIIIQH